MFNHLQHGTQSLLSDRVQQTIHHIQNNQDMIQVNKVRCLSSEKVCKVLGFDGVNYNVE